VFAHGVQVLACNFRAIAADAFFQEALDQRQALLSANLRGALVLVALPLLLRRDIGDCAGSRAMLRERGSVSGDQCW
jgi:hypothetical protein